MMREKASRSTFTLMRAQGSRANGKKFPMEGSISEPDYPDEDVHLGAESFIRVAGLT